MKSFLLASLLAAIAALAAVVAYRLSADALAMIVGVVLGLVALTPTVIIAVMLARRERRVDENMRQPTYPQPPVVVVSGGYPAHMLPQSQQNSALSLNQAMIPAPPSQQPRQFRMMGYEATEAVDLSEEEWTPLY